MGTRRLMSFLFLKTPSRDGGWAPTSQLHDCAYQALLISPPQKTRSPHWFQITPPPSPNSSLFRTTLCGVLVFDSVSRASSFSSSSAPSPPPLCHTTTFTHHFVTHQLCTHYLTHIFVNHHLSHASLSTTISHTHLCPPPSLTHIFVNHHLSHTSLSTTISHTHLCQPPSHLCQPPSLTHIFVHYHLSNTSYVHHHLSHISLSTTIFHIHLCQPPSLTHIFVHYHLSHTSLSTTIFHTTISHTHLCQPSLSASSLTHIFVNHHLSHTSLSTGRRGTWRHPPSFHVAGVALGGIYLGFAWQACIYLGFFAWQAWHLWHWVAVGLVLVACDAAALCVAGVAQCHIHLRFTWQAWRNVTSAFVSRGRRGVMSHPPSFCVAGVALMALGGALGLVLVACDAAALCVAVAQCHIHLRFTRQV